MGMMRDFNFKVNEHLTLKLEGEETVIYVAGERFLQCKFLLLEIPVEEIKSLTDIESIDEAAERLDHSLQPLGEKKEVLSPEVKFWGHCSNLMRRSKLYNIFSEKSRGFRPRVAIMRTQAQKVWALKHAW
jgi:hypothetical protein